MELAMHYHYTKDVAVLNRIEEPTPKYMLYNTSLLTWTAQLTLSRYVEDYRFETFETETKADRTIMDRKLIVYGQNSLPFDQLRIRYWKSQSSLEYQFSKLIIKAQNPPVLGQNTRISKSIQHKTKDIFLDQQSTNAADYIRRDFRCRVELQLRGKL
ncbi:hypothetical protein P5673_020356 [Acropora cervicornis]|uniref:Uncharacterized protein n=1 Tax=Acropora cervicornis TaxID=6130 RepID=A0AAD9QB36_ACRCE|nr:hypothetical protein P5673_020356 [Acropora cervicornis]